MQRVVPLIFLSLTVVGVMVWQAAAQQQQLDTRPQRLKPFMQQKLDHSKSILEALAVEDFEKLAKSAQALSLLSLESNWNVLTTDEYIQQSAAFRRACSVIQEAAREKNVDRAALGFMDLTVRCVECHKYLRKNAATPNRTNVQPSNK